MDGDIYSSSLSVCQAKVDEEKGMERRWAWWTRGEKPSSAARAGHGAERCG